MAPSSMRLRVLSVGGNAVSAFLSWRLQATNACDVTLVWKANYQAVAQYGISFKSKLFGNERFKPRHVVQTPEDATGREAAYDYVLLCVKALPDVYNLADIIQSVVTPQHTCILVNTTNTLGVEKELEERFPTNVVLSLVSTAGLNQLGSSEFEHVGSTEIWVGPANLESKIPQSIQRDMSEALAMTLTTGQVECKVSDNIRQQQYERMIGPIAFHPLSVIFETPVLADLIRKPGVRELVTEVIEELLQIAAKQKCSFDAEFKQKIIESMIQTSDMSTMYEDFSARRPMEVETYLGSPSKLAKSVDVQTPRIDTLYTILRHINTTNKDKPAPQPSSASTAHSAVTSGAPNGPIAPQVVNRMNPNPQVRPHPGAGPMNGNGRPMPPRGPPNGQGMPPPAGRRGPWPPNGNRPPPNGYPPRGQSAMARKPSFEGDNLDEFSHVVLYDDIAEGDGSAGYGENGGAHHSQSLKERELMLREREIALRQQEMAMRGRGGGRRASHAKHQDFDDDDDDEDFYEPGYGRGAGMPPIDPDNFDMMSVTSRRTKRAPSQTQLRKDMFNGGAPMRPQGYGRPPMGRHRTSAQLMAEMPTLGENIMNNPMIGFSSNRYGTVDRKEMADESRANSLTASRLHDMGGASGPYPPPVRRTSRSPGNPFQPVGRGQGRPGPANDPYAQGRNGRPSPPGAMQAPIPRYPPGQGPMVPPAHQIEQTAGVSKTYPQPHKVPTKSLTGSASASAGSGDSGSANIESDPSAHSSTSSFAPRTMIHA